MLLNSWRLCVYHQPWITALLHTTQSCIASNVVCTLNYIHGDVSKLPCDVSLWFKK